VAGERKHDGWLVAFYLRDSGWAALVQVTQVLEAQSPQLHGQVGSEDDSGSLDIEALAASSEAAAPRGDIASLPRVSSSRRARALRSRFLWANSAVAPTASLFSTRDNSAQARAVLVPTVRDLRQPAQRTRAERLRRELAAATGVRGR
jgi:hypothetical protein